MAEKTDDLLISISTDLTTVRRALKRLETDIAASTSTVQKQFDGLGKGIDKSMTTAMQARIDQMVGIGAKATKEWNGVLSDQGKELDRLRAKFSPVFSTISQYKSTIGEIRQAHSLGAISADEMAAAMSRERQAALASIAAIKGRNAAIEAAPGARGAGRFETANIAAQFQDIAVTSAMGMSPLQIALQQGTQLSAVLGPMGATGAVKGLGAAFASVVSPVSLLTIGVVGLSAAAIQYFSSLFSESSKAEEALKREVEAIKQIADRWGEAMPALKAYADERQRLADDTAIKEAANAAAENQWDGLRKKISELNVSLAESMSLLQTFGAETTEISSLQREFTKLADGVEKGTAKAEDAQRVHDILLKLVKQTGIPEIDAFAQSFVGLSAAISTASGEAAKLREGAAALIDITKKLPGNLGQLQPVFSAGGKFINEEQAQTVRADATKSKAQQEMERLQRANSGASRRAERDANAYRDLVKSAQDRIEQMELEERLVGKTGIAADAYRMKLELLQAATEKGRTIDEKKRRELEALADQYEKVAQRVAGLAMAEDLAFERAQMFRSSTEQRVYGQLRSAGIDPSSAQGEMLAGQIRLNEQLALGRDLTMDFASGLVSDLMDSKNAMDALANAAGRLGDKLLDIALNEAINGLFGKLGGGILGGLGGGSGGALTNLPLGVGLYSAGGYTGPGGKHEPAGVVHKGEVVFDQAAVRGAGGPAALEALRKRLKGYSNGGIVGGGVPAAQPIAMPAMPRLQAPANQNGVSFAPVYQIDARGADQAAIARLEAKLDKTNQEMNARVIAAVRGAQSKNVKLR